MNQMDPNTHQLFPDTLFYSCTEYEKRKKKIQYLSLNTKKIKNSIRDRSLLQSCIVSGLLSNLSNQTNKIQPVKAVIPRVRSRDKKHQQGNRIVSENAKRGEIRCPKWARESRERWR